jgi:hypothetical protein
MWQTTFILIFILIFLLLHIANAEEASAQKFTNTFDKIRCKKEGKFSKKTRFGTDFQDFKGTFGKLRTLRQILAKRKQT